jgi:hypothetical protein
LIKILSGAFLTLHYMFLINFLFKLMKILSGAFLFLHYILFFQFLFKIDDKSHLEPPSSSNTYFIFNSYPKMMRKLSQLCIHAP